MVGQAQRLGWVDKRNKVHRGKGRKWGRMWGRADAEHAARLADDRASCKDDRANCKAASIRMDGIDKQELTNKKWGR